MLDGIKVVSLQRGPIGHDARVRKNAKWLREMGAEVVYVVFSSQQVDLPVASTEMGVYDGCKYIQVWLPGHQHIPQIVMAEKPDVVHAHELEALTLFCSQWDNRVGTLRRQGKTAEQAQQQFKRPILRLDENKQPWPKLIYDAHELEADRRSVGAPLEAITDRRWRDALLTPLADAIISPSRSINNLLAEQYHKPTYLVTNSVPEPGRPLDPTNARQMLQAKPGCRDKPVVVFCGNLTPARHLDAVYEVVTEIGAALLLVGTWLNAGTSIEATKQRLVSAPNVVHIPAQPYPHPENAPVMLDCISAGNVAVHLTDHWVTSYERSLGNKVFEYAAAGVPCVVSSHMSENIKLIEHYGIGSACGTSKADLCNQLLHWIKNPPKPKCFVNFNNDYYFGNGPGKELNRLYRDLTSRG